MTCARKCQDEDIGHESENVAEIQNRCRCDQAGKQVTGRNKNGSDRTHARALWPAVVEVLKRRAEYTFIRVQEGVVGSENKTQRWIGSHFAEPISRNNVFVGILADFHHDETHLNLFVVPAKTRLCAKRVSLVTLNVTAA